MSKGVSTIIHNWLSRILHSILKHSTITKNKESVEICFTPPKNQPKKFSYESEPSGQYNQFIYDLQYKVGLFKTIRENPPYVANSFYFLPFFNFVYWLISFLTTSKSPNLHLHLEVQNFLPKKLRTNIRENYVKGLWIPKVFCTAEIIYWLTDNT